MKDESEKRKLRIKVVVNEKEKKAIEAAASDCSKSASSYLRTLGLGYAPPSKIDKNHILDLAKINGDQGRLGGLLKMWLTNEERQEEVISGQVRQLIEQISEAQKELLSAVKKL